MESKLLQNLITIDAVCVTIPYIRRLSNQQQPKAKVNQYYNEWYNQKIWFVRMIHYVILVTAYQLLRSALQYLNFPSGTLTLYYITLFNAFPVFQNRVLSTHFGKAYTHFLQTTYIDIFRYVVLLFVSVIIKDNVEDPVLREKITVVRLIARLQFDHLLRITRNMVVLYILQHLRAKSSTYVYYKFIKYTYRYYYNYDYSNMTKEKALYNLTMVLTDRPWNEVSEPLFLHSLLTLEANKSMTETRLDQIVYFVNHVFTTWTLLDFSFLFTTSVVAYVQRGKAITVEFATKIIVAYLVYSFSLSKPLTAVILSSPNKLWNPRQFQVIFVLLRKSVVNQLEGYVEVKEETIVSSDGEYGIISLK